MMKRLLVALAVAALPATATAAAGGLGFTAHMGHSRSANGHYPFWSGGMNTFRTLPTIDWRGNGYVIQVDALETIDSIFSKEVDTDGDETNGLHLGVSAFKSHIKNQINGHTEGVIQPGIQIDVDTNLAFDPAELMVAGAMRAGAQTSDKMGIGIYVVPSLGFARGLEADKDGDIVGKLDVVVGGHVQIAVWQKK